MEQDHHSRSFPEFFRNDVVVRYARTSREGSLGQSDSLHSLGAPHLVPGPKLERPMVSVEGAVRLTAFCCPLVYRTGQAIDCPALDVIPSDVVHRRSPPRDVCNIVATAEASKSDSAYITMNLEQLLHFL
jgi:hypothetical protein